MALKNPFLALHPGAGPGPAQQRLLLGAALDHHGGELRAGCLCLDSWSGWCVHRLVSRWYCPNPAVAASTVHRVVVRQRVLRCDCPPLLSTTCVLCSPQVAANVGGWIADTLVERGWSVTTVRKVMQTVREGRPGCTAHWRALLRVICGCCMMACTVCTAIPRAAAAAASLTPSLPRRLAASLPNCRSASWALLSS